MQNSLKMTLNQNAQSFRGITLKKSLVKRTPGSKSEVGMTYQYAVTAFLAAKMSADDNVEDYVIYSSESSAGKFDDVIVRVSLKDPNNSYLCLVQVKHKEGKKLNISDTLKGKSVQYFLTHYVNSFNEIMGDSSLICRQGIVNENIRFAIVTNETVQVPVFLRGQTTFELNTESYSEESGINKTLLPFEGESRKLACEHTEAAEYQNFFQGCHLFLNQPNCELIKKCVQTICEIDNANDIVAYVNDYFNDDSLHKQGLSKDQFEIELLKIRYANSIIRLSQPAELINEELIDIWNKITTDQDITIVSNSKDPNIETCLLSCWGQNVISLLNLDINLNNLINNRSLDKEIIERFKQYSKSKGRRYWLSMPNNFKSLLIELWKYGELPLILNTNSKLDPFRKRMHLRRRYVILDDISKRNEEINMASFDVKLCSHIGNIACMKLRDNLLQTVKISLQGHTPITLKTLLGDDIKLMETFSTADIIGFMMRIVPYVKPYYLNGVNYLAFLIEDDSIKNCVGFKNAEEIGNNMEITGSNKEIEDYIKMITTNQEYENYTVCCLRENKQLELIRGDLSTLRNCFNDQYGNPVYYSEENKFVPVIGLPVTLEKHDYMSRCLRNATIPPSYFELEQTHICLVLGDNDFENTRFIEIDINAAEIELPEKKSNFIKVNEGNRQAYWDKLVALKYPLLEIVIKDGKMELLRYKYCENLNDFIAFDGETVSEEEIVKDVNTGCNKITIITGEPGIGKTSLLNFFCNLSETQGYILLYDLRNFQIDLRQNKKLFNDPVRYIFENFHKGSVRQFQDFIRQLLENKKVILVLDSFDEIVSACEGEVLELINMLENSGIRILIASRLSGCNVLMRKFEVRIVNLEPLNANDISNYLAKWRINENQLVKFPVKFKANPLYLSFLRLITEYPEQFLNISRFQLYEKVVIMKIRRNFEINNKIFAQSEVERAVALLERFSLEVIFGREKIEQSLKWGENGRIHDYTKYGIITSFDDDGYATFYHFTFVEFLVARWLINAQYIAMYKDLARDMYQQLWKDNKMHILDILSEHLTPHQAVLQSDIPKAEKLQAEDRSCWKIADALGRTALHLATIRCKYSSRQSVSFKMLELIVQSMQCNADELDKRDTIIKWDWTGYVDSDMFQYLLNDSCVKILKVYLNCKRRNVNNIDDGLDIFPLSNFQVVYRVVISYYCIEMIRGLLFLQNRKDSKFMDLYRNCSLATVTFSNSWINLDMEGNLTPLHVACIYDSGPMIQCLIEEGCELDVIDNFGCTPLQYSSILNVLDCTRCDSDTAKNSNINIMNLLLQNGADVNRTDECWGTPLYIGVKTKNPDVVRNLLYNERINGDLALALRDISAQNLDGTTPLHLAVEIGHAQITELLLVKGANANSLNRNRESPFGLAIRIGNKDIMNKLKPYIDINFQNPYSGRTYLHYAVEEENSYIVSYLLRRGVDANAQNIYDETPLHYSVKTANIGISQMLLEHGAKVFVENVYSKTPLYYAAEAKNMEFFQLLLEKNPNRQHAIHLAVISQNLDLVEDLINGIKFTDDNTTCFSENYTATSEKNIIKAEYETVETGMRSLHSSMQLQNVEPIEIVNRLEETVSITDDKDEINKALNEKGVDINMADDNGCTPLHLSLLHYQNIEIPRFLIENGADINRAENNGLTPLHLSTICYEYVDIAKLLIERGADIDITSDGGVTALYQSIRFKNKEITKVLIERGADINIGGEDGYTPLHLSVISQDIEITKLLIEKGAGINTTANNGRTPFYSSTMNEDSEIVKLLIEKGADINKIDRYGRTSLYLCIAFQDLEIIKLLIEKGLDINKADNNGCTPLFESIRYQNLDVIKLLIENGADIDTANRNGDTPLHISVCYLDTEITKFLIEKGANINKADNNGGTPLYLSIGSKSLGFPKLFIEAGADINKANNTGRTPLYKSIGFQNLDIIKLLVENGADINVADKDGDTPLHRSIAFQDIEITKFLIENGADINAADENGDTPLHLSIAFQDIEITKFLIENTTDINKTNSYGCTYLHLCIALQDLDIIKLLIEKGADINIRNENGYTSLHESICFPNIEITKFLIENGADINAADEDGYTPLHESVRFSDIEITKFLIENGADITKTDNYGRRYLHICIALQDLDIIKILIENGADINAADEDGDTPLHESVRFSDIEITKFLIENCADVNKNNNNGYTPLHLSLNNFRNLEIAELLIEGGADVNMTTNFQDSELTELLIENDDDNTADNNGDASVCSVTIPTRKSRRCCMLL